MERQSGIYYFFEKIILSQNIKLFLLKTNFLFVKAMILLKIHNFWHGRTCRYAETEMLDIQ